MARQVLPIVGAVIGAYFGNPQLGYAIGTIVGNAVDPLVVDGPKIGDVAQQTSSEGVYQPIYFGTAQGAGNIIAQGPNIIRKRKSQQGKGGGPVTVTESLYKTFAIRIGVSWQDEIGISGVTRIWENGKLVYDSRPESQIIAESAEFENKFRLYLGTDDQLPDPDLEAIYGIGNTPSYRGRAYIVFPLYNITEWRAIPQYSFEVVTGGGSVPAYDTMMSGDRIAAGGEYGFASISDNAETWNIILDSQLTFRGIPVFGENRWVVVNNGQCAYTDDLTGLSGWQLGSVSPGPNTLTDAKHLGNGVIVACGLSDTVLISRDNGENFEVVDVPDSGNHVCVITSYDGECIIGSGSNNAHIFTQNYGHSFSQTSNKATSYSLDAGYYHVVDEAWYVGGGTSVPIDPGEIVRLSNVSAEPALLVSTPSKVKAMAMRPREHIDGELQIALCHSGEIVYSRNDWITHTISSQSLPPEDTGRLMVFDGQRFIIGWDGDVGENASVFIMTDPEVLEGPYPTILTDNYKIETSFMGVTSVSGQPPTLDQVVTYIHSLCGMPSSTIDVSDLSSIIVRGWILAGPYSGKDCINSMQGLWQFDSPEYDKKIRYSLRGNDVVRVFTFDDLIDEPEEATREQAIEYPKKANLDYQSPAVDYAPAKATSSRSSIDAKVVGEANIQVPVVLTPDEAAQRVTVFHKVFWADADGEVVFSVSDENLDLVPGDCIGLSLRGTIRRLRIVQMEIAAGVLKLTCRNDRQSAYTSNVTGIDPPPPTPPPPSIVGPTMLIVGDWPALRDQDDISTFVKYIAMGGVSEAWRGALGEVSTDLGNTYNDMLDVTQGAVMGTLQDDITDAAPYFADHTNVLLIQLDMTDGSIEIDSLTEAQFLSEQGGIALVKSDGSFEIMQYRDANDLGDGLYELSYLQRGRLDSTTQSFSIGDRFVLLDSIAVVTAPVSHLGLDIYHRATSYGNTTESGTVVHDVFEGNSQKEWPISHLFLEVAGDTINGTIVPRHRFGTEANPIRSINWTGYEIQFQDETDQIDTITQTSDVFTYDASAMTFPVTVSVSQINRLTGAGPSLSEVTP